MYSARESLKCEPLNALRMRSRQVIKMSEGGQVTDKRDSPKECLNGSTDLQLVVMQVHRQVQWGRLFCFQEHWWITTDMWSLSILNVIQTNQDLSPLQTKKITLRGACVPQSVKWLTLGFSSGHDLGLWDGALHWAPSSERSLLKFLSSSPSAPPCVLSLALFLK